ncbi:hypothetical protein ARMGADRAFT_1080805 [Armillaria gallica]|uniref:DNase I-like protein n=1 Tax=Armillaria gallica TaxID=47427 RepID=A0A2H3DFX9_ARMGA|nr:hypothetical protein ARMGADRAFT_1080805 [Armillaria gallica]
MVNSASTARLKQLKIAIHEFCRETDGNFDNIGKRLDTVEDGLKQAVKTVALMGQIMRNTQTNDYLLSKLYEADDSSEEARIEYELDKLAKRIDEADDKLDDLDRTITGLITAPSQTLPVLHIVTPATSSPTCPALFIVFPYVAAVTVGPVYPSAAFSIYALNANGMHYALKIVHINNAIGYQNPSVFVISELKSSTSVAGRISAGKYNIFEERSQPTTGTWKWGVILGVRSNIQIVQRLSISDAILKSWVLAVDIALSDSNGRAFLHRVFAVYAPWNPGGNSVNFWTSLANLCNSTPHGWSLAGDLNATVSSIERASSGDDNRRYFRDFLERTNGQDLWQKNPDQSARNDWTCQAKDRDRGGNIFDRIVTSGHGILDGYIHAAASSQDYIPVTDHRLVCAYIIPTPRTGIFITRETLNPDPKVSRIRYPKATEKALFKAYEAEAEQMAEELGLFEVEVNDEASWIRVYKGLTKIVTDCTEQHFGRNRPYSKSSTMAALTSPMIQALLAERRHIGGSLYLLRNPEKAQVSPGTIAYLQRFMRRIPHGSLDSTETLVSPRQTTIYLF